MTIPSMFRPKDALTEAERSSGARWMNLQAAVAAAADGVASAGFLAAFALVLGASNIHIGIMTAIPFIVQPLQILAVVAVERLRMRKIVVVPSYIAAYVVWIPIALIPFAIDVPNAGAVTVLLFFIAVRGGAYAFVNPGWTAWLQDMAPKGGEGRFFAQRFRVATIAMAATGLAAALYIDWWKGAVSESSVVYGYSYAMLLGSILLGFGSVGVMTRIPEPSMAAPEGGRPSIAALILAPLKDRNFRKLVEFLFAWNFVAYLAVPFLTVYMLTTLDIPLSIVVGLGVLSQLTNVLFLRVWGPLIDRYGSKVVLSVCSSLYFLSILGWTFTTMPGRYSGTIPVLILLHAFMGVAGAGVNIATTTIRMKLAPPAQATAFLMSASLAANLGAGISPLLGGAFVDFFSVRQFKIGVEWIDPIRAVDFPAIFLTGYDFLFAGAFVLGLFTLSLLGRVKEAGEARSGAVMDELLTQTRENLRSLDSVPGLSVASSISLAGIRYLPPIPGLNVAAGVTAYQVASTTKYAVEAVGRSGERAMRVRDRVNQAVTDAAKGTEGAGRHGIPVAFGAVRGAVAAAAGTRGVIGAALSGTLDAMGKTAANPSEAIRGAVYGAIYGANDAGTQLSDVVSQAVQSARDAAADLGLSEEEAVKQAAQAAVEASRDLAGESELEVREALIEELVRDRGQPPA